MTTGFTNVKDVDRLILDAADDKTLLNILLMNKNLVKLGEEAFKRRMLKYYPYLAKKKPESISWSKYYLSNVYYINKLKEEFDLDYYPVPTFYPEGVYRLLSYIKHYEEGRINNFKDILIRDFAIEMGDEKTLQKFIDKNSNNFLIILSKLLENSNIPLFEKMISGSSQALFEEVMEEDPLELIGGAVASGKREVVDYIINKINEYDNSILKSDPEKEATFETATDAAARKGDLNMLNYLDTRFPKFDLNLKNILSIAARNEQIDFIKYFLAKPENSNTIKDSLPSIINDYLSLAIYKPVSQSELESGLRFLLETYISLVGYEIAKTQLGNILLDIRGIKVKDPGLQKILKEYGIPYISRHSKYY